MSTQVVVFLFALTMVMVLSVVLKKLTVLGAIAGGLIGCGVYAGAGVAGLALLGTFFILGNAATAFKRSWKQQAGISKKEEGKRTASQVFANGGVAVILGVLAFAFPQLESVFKFLIAASLSAATADTLSSELGVVYGRRFYNIRTLKNDMRGLDGVVSWEGLLLGVAGSVSITLVYAAAVGFDKRCFWIVVAGTIGNLADSYLGATWERKKILSNDAVNFFNTAVAAFIAWLLLQF